MTSLNKLAMTLFREKVKTVHTVVGIEIIGILVSIVMMFFSATNKSSLPNGILAVSAVVSVLAGIVVFFVLLNRQERVWTRNFYRLLSVSDTKLYLGNILSVVVSYLYFALLQLIILAIFNIGSYKYLNFVKDAPIQVIFSAMLMVFMTCFFTTIFLAMIHLMVEAISAYLPRTHQNVIKIVLYVVVFLIINRVVYYVDQFIGKVFNGLFVNIDKLDTLRQASTSMLLGSGYLVIALFLVSLINIYLLSHLVETDPQSM